MEPELQKKLNAFFKPQVSYEYDRIVSNLNRIPNDWAILWWLEKTNHHYQVYKLCCKKFSIFQLPHELNNVITSYISYSHVTYQMVKYHILSGFYDKLYTLRYDNVLLEELSPTKCYLFRKRVANRIFQDIVKFKRKMDIMNIYECI